MVTWKNKKEKKKSRKNRVNKLMVINERFKRKQAERVKSSVASVPSETWQR